MNQAYIVVEEALIGALMERLLPTDWAGEIQVLSAEGRSDASALAQSLLAVKRRPVALLLDADTRDPQRVREQCTWLRELLGPSAGTAAFEVFLAVPAIMETLVDARAVWERLLGHSLRDADWQQQRADPHKAQQALVAATGTESEPGLRFDQLDDSDLSALAQQAPFAPLIEFLQETLRAQRRATELEQKLSELATQS